MKPTRISAPALLALLAACATPLAASTILVDFGAASTPTPREGAAWNNIDEKNQGAPQGHPLLDINGNATGAVLQVTKSFAGANPNGATDTSLAYPAAAIRDSLYGNIEKFGNRENVLPEIALVGLDPKKHYTLTFFASRMKTNGDDRTTRYTLTGANTVTTDLNVSENIDHSATTAAVRPSADGKLVIGLAPGPTNNNANHFIYLGVLEINEAE